MEAQLYQDHYGAGHTQGMKVTSSTSSNNEVKVVEGATDALSLEESSRFLSQTTLGASYEDILHMQSIGIEAWLDEQINMTSGSMYDRVEALWTNEIDPIQGDDRSFEMVLDFAFYEMIMEQEDALRQRMAFAWSQIFVIQETHREINHNLGHALYYDYLYKGAFGNFEDLLYNVTMSMSMGVYLSHYKNRKFNPDNGSLPDENFAREIMQLFTIGIHELELDGTPKLDSNGEPIPTYNIDDVAELAKVFTGLAASKNKKTGANNNSFGLGYPSRDWTSPMKMFDDFHSEGEKTFLGTTLPAGQTGMKDINDALDILFNHPNVAPFLSKTMIQHLIKSNPSPAYVKRVATIFEDNGQGVRGDMEAFTRAILLDPEARECDYITNPTAGKLIQPLERFIQLFKAFDLETPSGKIWMNDDKEYVEKILQGFNNSPSVFNFFTPDYAEDMFIAPQDLTSPEFEILNTVTAISYINEVEDALKDRPFDNRTKSGQFLGINNNDVPTLDLSDEISIYQSGGTAQLLDRLNILLCRGQLSSDVRNIIISTIASNEANINNYSNLNAVRDCIYYVMMSADYIIQL